jgi:signal-transduction protein with cAMP-binding, CBS, and nucleotidyltransferase domain
MDREGIPVAQLMTSSIRTVTPDTAVTDAAGTFVTENIGSVIVVDDDDRPVGILTTTDLAEIVSTNVLDADAPVERYMTDRVITVGAQDSIRDAAARMLRHGVHHLPVTDDDGTVSGMLSTMDLTAYFSYTAGTDTE